MTVWQLGQTVSWVLEVRDSAGALADLGGGNPTGTVTLPDATTTSATVTKTATGTYAGSVAGSQAGRYRITWAGTGTNSGALPYTDVADVWPANPRLVIGLADAKAALNIAPTVNVNDDEIRLYIAAATAAIEDVCGPVLADTVTETRSGGSPAIPLCSLPAAVSTVSEDGVTLTASDWCVDEAGILWRGSKPGAGTWSAGARNVIVTYTVGSSTVPPLVVKAARDLVAWQYREQQLRRPGPSYGPQTGEPLYLPSRSRTEILAELAPLAAGRVPGLA